ncbi:MAG TPA: ribonuclease P protein component [Rhodospirillaceae bacterium]|nr:ribonuclease P protein component [Rhodospirillaceae bacterium]HAA93190.1 ribonuclease P protein component [Rhodospirillaceae bacterium]HAT36766.1 ribonuclease P protein component [Rhodospirillaceae bacterium]
MPPGVEPLKRRAQFLRVAAARRKYVTPGLLLQACGNAEDGEAVRVGYTASRKVGNAVARNRAKRRLRAAVGEVMPLHAAAGHDYVVIARRATSSRSFPALLRDLETAMKKLELWREAGAQSPAREG